MFWKVQNLFILFYFHFYLFIYLFILFINLLFIYFYLFVLFLFVFFGRKIWRFKHMYPYWLLYHPWGPFY